MVSASLVGGLEHDFYFSIQLGSSSSQLTNSNLFQRGRVQPPTISIDSPQIIIRLSIDHQPPTKSWQKIHGGSRRSSGPLRCQVVQCDQPDLADGIAFMSCPIKEAMESDGGPWLGRFERQELGIWWIHIYIAYVYIYICVCVCSIWIICIYYVYQCISLI